MASGPISITPTPQSFAAAPSPRGHLFSVAQVSNLPYRRFPIGRTFGSSGAHEDSHDSQAGSPAIQQVGNLRYSTSEPLNTYTSSAISQEGHIAVGAQETAEAVLTATATPTHPAEAGV